MAKKPDEYVIAILMKGYKIKFVTALGEGHTAYWNDGEEAMSFSKTFATEMCMGFAWNGISAMPILKQSYLTYKNPEKTKEEE